MTLGAIVITAVALVVGLGALYLSWRFVSGLPADRPGEPIEEQRAEHARREHARREHAEEVEVGEVEAEDLEEPGRRRTSPSEWVAGAAIALGLVGLAVFFIREFGSR